MYGAKKLLKQIKNQAIKVKVPASRPVARLRVPRPLAQKSTISFTVRKPKIKF